LDISEIVKVLEIVTESIPNIAGYATAEEIEEMAGIIMRFVEIFDKIRKHEEFSMSLEAFNQLMASLIY
jgi:hypothetical protein